MYTVNPSPNWSVPNNLDSFVAGVIPWNREMAVELAGNGFKTLQTIATASARAWVDVVLEMVWLGLPTLRI